MQNLCLKVTNSKMHISTMCVIILLFAQPQHSSTTCDSVFGCAQKAVSEIERLNAQTLTQNDLLRQILSFVSVPSPPQSEHQDSVPQLSYIMDLMCYVNTTSENISILFFIKHFSYVFTQPCNYLQRFICRKHYIVNVPPEPSTVIVAETSIEFELLHQIFVYLNSTVDCDFVKSYVDYEAGKTPLVSVRKCQFERGTKPCPKSQYCCEVGLLPYFYSVVPMNSCTIISGKDECRDFLPSMSQLRTDIHHKSVVADDEACPASWRLPLPAYGLSPECLDLPSCSDFVACDGFYRCY